MVNELKRAKDALDAAERNLNDFKDVNTAANRIFFACEPLAHALIEKRLGNIPKTRIKLQRNMKSLNPALKQTYDESYDLRMQADYGCDFKHLQLSEENVRIIINKVKHLYV